MQSGEGLPSFNKDNVDVVYQKYKEAFRGVFENMRKKLSLKPWPRCRSQLSLNLKDLYSVSRHIMWSHDKFVREHPCKE